MPKAFAEFFAKALSMDGGIHTLVVGELHDATEHLEFLQRNLGDLKDRYGIQTIGLEWPAYFNLFLWAYADGTLERELGSKEKAQAYMHALGFGYTDLSIAAMDAGIQVVAFDTRKSTSWVWEERYYDGEHQQMLLDEAARLKEKGITASSDDILRQWRANPATIPDRIADRGIWELGEMDWLLSLNPDYQAKLDAMQRLIDVGRQKIEEQKLTEDGLSAVLFHAASAKGNRLTISGTAHMDGVGAYGYTHGVFGQHLKHLFAPEQPPDEHHVHHVTEAVIATTAVAQRIDDLKKQSWRPRREKAIAGHEVSLMNLDKGSIGTIWQPDPAIEKNRAGIVPLEDKFPMPSDVPADQRDAHRKAHINPLLMPDIKAAAEAVRTAMHGAEPGRLL